LGDRRDVDPVREVEWCRAVAWLTDVLQRVVSGRTKYHEIDTLLPWTWKTAKDAQTASTA